MAQTAARSYFPPLNQCFADGTRLVSWRVAYRALSEKVSQEDESSLHQFLTSEEAINTLCAIPSPFDTAPSGPSKTRFETKTAPTQVSQASNGEYSLDEIKQDSLWLSKELNIEEMVALRFVVIEWQQRPAEKLLQGANGGTRPDSADGASLGASTLSRSAAGFFAGSTNGITSTFGEKNKRRDRLLRIYLEEKEAVLKVYAAIVTGRAFTDHASIGSTDATATDAWQRRLGFDVMQQQYGNDHRRAQEFCLNRIMPYLRAQATEEQRQAMPKVFTSEPTKLEIYRASKAHNFTEVLRILLSCSWSLPVIPRSDYVKGWFTLMEELTFLQDEQQLATDPASSPISVMVALISLSVLQVTQVVARLRSHYVGIQRNDAQHPNLPGNKDSDYYTDNECLSKIMIVLSKAVTWNALVAAPAIYAWSIITSNIQSLSLLRIAQREGMPLQIEERRRSSIRLTTTSEQLSEWEQRYQALTNDPQLGGLQGDLPRILADRAVHALLVNPVISSLSGAVSSTWESATTAATSFMAKDTLFEVLSNGMIWSDYSEDVLEAIFALLDPGMAGTISETHTHILARKLLADSEYLRPLVFDKARSRYPYELSPFVRLLALIAPAAPSDVLEMLESQRTITLMVPVHFRSYRLESEEEGVNEMLLTDNLPIFERRQMATLHAGNPLPTTDGQSHRDTLRQVAAGSSGSIVREDPPRVLRLEHPHSVLEYLGLLLSTILPSSQFVPAPPHATLDRSTAADIINLINALIKPSSQRQWLENAKLVLYQSSTALSHEEDIVSLLAEIMEMELLAHLDQSPQEGSLELVVACARFFNALSQISPERVWTLLCRSSLLGVSGGTSALVAVVAGAEVQMGQYHFLVACTELYTHLLDDAIAGLVKRKNLLSKRSGNRFDTPTETAESPPERIITTVLNAYQRIMIEAFQNLASWRFDIPEEKLSLSKAMATSFDLLLRVTHGLNDPETKIDEDALDKHRISAILSPAAEMVIEAFAAVSGNSPVLDSLQGLLCDGLATGDDALSPRLRSVLIDETEALCGFTSRLLCTTRHINTRRAGSLANDLLRRSMITLASLYASDHVYRAAISTLLTEIVEGLGAAGSEPAAILGPLDAESGKAFLTLVAQLDQPLKNEDVEVQIWNLLSTVLSARQQWFAVYLLTGSLPKDRLQAKQGQSRSKSLLSYALEQLSDLPSLLTDRAKAMLQFVKVSQEVWVWATTQVRSSADFTKNALKWLNDLQIRRNQPADPMVRANEYYMAALVCDILALALHASMEVGDKTLLAQMNQNLAFLQGNGVAIDSYNRSLHLNLADNLKTRYQECELADFRRSDANSAGPGDNFVYDLNLADRMLNHDAAWKQASNGRNRREGFLDEFKRANLNLSLVDAQTTLLKSWKTLSATLCEHVASEQWLQASLVEAATSCLEANASANVDQPGTAEALQSRADMAFILMSKLVVIESKEKGMKQLLASAWSLVRSSPVDFDVATAQEDLTYYRTLLQILYLAIQPHVYMKLAPIGGADSGEVPLLSPDVGAILVDIVRRTIAPGFRALCGNLHNDLQLALPSDFALINAILQGVLSVRGVTTVHAQLGEVIAVSSIVRGALSLYSWADRLAEATNDDPVYGELAITLLLTLSSMAPAAEQMALSGALTQLSSANLSNYFRKSGGKGPFGAPQRMFSIWSEGFLPLCLNVLDAVGAPVAAEVAFFLNAFPEQLHRAETSLQPHAPRPKSHSGNITLGLVKEAHSLILISLIIQSDAARAAAEGINAIDIPELSLDVQVIKDSVEALPRSQRSLVDRVVATSDREVEWANTNAPGSPNSLLVERVIQEVNSAIEIFGGGNGEGA